MTKINCDLCGRIAEDLAKAVIEGVTLDVCKDCSKFGKVVSQPIRPGAKEQAKRFQSLQKEEKSETLVENFTELVKKKREAMNLTQKDFAGKINEKETMIHKIETGSFTPPLPLVKKIERLLGIKLTEEYSEAQETVRSSRREGFTLGDFIKVKGK
ncbi:TIGR00270 family protein [Candidatus Woesearchaeota archaeon]|nr:TIGR00270 family protein [Candidatus Woesearchaeota archaeon]